ncbi:ATP-binding Cassette (ABC) Superfamily [Thraustotheca clavata]|uniref:ATP-binding Cassette (ABC) Superfamily n=1 Tax=Thraustotheca clavata TaxID=74557 RepID=A0A1V9ZFI0_9STRA|nr:ATP-binding Cassette (ABC) Superfamily [Thraustotheca clavata]
MDKAEFVQVETPKGNNDVDVTSTSSEQTKSSPMVSMTKLFTFADSTDKILMAVGTVTAMLTGVSQPVQIIFFGDIINAFNPTQGGKIDDDEFRHSINKVVVQFVILGVLVMICGFTQIACWSIAASRQAKRLRHAYAAAILRQEVGWFDVNEPMQLATKVADTTLIIQEGMGRKVADGINFSTMALSGFIIAFAYGWELALVLFAFTPLIAASGYFMIKAISSATQGGVESYAEAGGVAEESLSNIKTVHMFNAMAKMAEKYKAALFKTELAGVKKGLAVGVGTGGMFFVVFCTYAVGMYYGAVKVTKDQIPAGSCTSHCYDGGRVITVFFSIVMSSMALGQAGPSAQAMFSARTAAHGVFELIERQSKIDADADSGLKPSTVRGDIALNNIAFAYPSRPEVQVCAGYSLQIPAGQKIALVGSSGCGKSTIVSLLERFYDPLQGSVTLDGHNLKDLNIRWLRQQIGLVGQEPCLFQETIANNIRHGKPGASLEEVYAAAKQANAYDFIMGFPDGFDTEVGDRGAQLSGGQKQRIAIARAIIKNPSILILDEATSALDTESEHIVQASLDHMMATGNRTTIIIAHRLSTIRNADRIAVLNAGNVVEDGTHESLLAIPNGLYKSLVESDDFESDEDSSQPVTGHNRLQSRQDALCNDGTGSEVDDNEVAKDVPVSRDWGLSRPEMLNFVLGGLSVVINGTIFPVWGVLLAKFIVPYFQTFRGSDGMRALKWSGAFIEINLLGTYFAKLSACNCM